MFFWIFINKVRDPHHIYKISTIFVFFGKIEQTNLIILINEASQRSV